MSDENELVARRYWIRRVAIASQFELMLTFVVWLVVQVGLLLRLRHYPFLSVEAAADMMTNPIFLLTSFYSFLVTMQWMLFRRTPFASAIARGIPFSRIIPAAISSVSEFKHEDDVIEEPAASVEISSGPDQVSSLITKMLDRSRNTSKTAELRPNFLLALGGAIAVLGLIFFFLTLPQSAKSNVDIVGRMLEMTPRVLMLLFIQVLAGFFLRQYRSSMEEFRYYEAILRYREDILISYTVRKSLNRDDLLADLGQEILITRDLAKLKTGESTTILESQKMSENDLAGLGQQILDLVKGAKFFDKK